MTKFSPTNQWQTVPSGAILPAGCEVIADVATGERRARLRQDADYNYLDESGRLLFQVTRRVDQDGEKVIRQRRPDGRGGWIHTLGDTRRVLYRLPEVLGADPALPVFVAEGEKDVDRLALGGLVATCSPHGAGRWENRRESYDRALQGRSVVILPDNDDAGHAHAAQVARCIADDAASVRVLDLPGLPHKGDVSDWLDNGGDVAGLLALARTAPTGAAWLAAHAPEPEPEPEPVPTDDAGAGDLWTGGDEQAEVERRTLAAIAHALAKRGKRPNVYNCPLDHSKEGKDFYFDLETGKIGGCQGKHGGELKRWRDLAEHLGIEVSQIARDVAQENRARRNAQALVDGADPVPYYDNPKWRAWYADQVTGWDVQGEVQVDPVNAQYPDLTELPEAPAVVIRSPMGTGKTTAISQWVKSGKYRRVLAVVHRRTLAGQLADRIPGAVNYETLLDKSEMGAADKLVCCANSLYHLLKVNQDDLTVSLPHYDLVILEETEALFDHMTGRTFSPMEEAQAWAILRGLARNAGQVVALDAGAGRKTHELVEMLTGEPPIWIVNEYKPQRPTMQFYDTPAEVLAVAEATIKAGQRVYLTTDWKRLAREFSTMYPAALAVHSESDQDVAERMITLDADFAEAGILVASPSLDAGVDLQTPAVVLAIFQGGGNGVLSQWQQLGRLRNPIGDIHIHYREYHRGRDYPSDYKPEVVEKHLRKTDAKLLQATIPNFDADGQILQDENQATVYRAHALVEAERNLHDRDRKAAFQALAVAKGYTVQRAGYTADLEAMEARHADAAETLKRGDRRLLLESEPVDDVEYEHHRHTGTLTEELRAGYTRWQLERIFAEDLTDELADEAAKHNYLATVKAFRDFLTPTEVLRQQDETDLEPLPDGTRAALPRLQFRAKRKDLTAWLFDLAGLAGGDLQNAGGWEFTERELEAFMDTVDAHRPFVRRLLGLRLRKGKHTPINALREILRTLGLRLESRQIQEDGRRGMLYCLDLGQVGRMVELVGNRSPDDDCKMSYIPGIDSLEKSQILGHITMPVIEKAVELTQ